METLVRALVYKNVPFELRDPTGPEGDRLGPKTEVLAVADLDGERIGDAMSVLQELDERFPDPPLLADDARTADAQRRLTHWVVESLLWYGTRWERLRPESAEPREPVAPPRPAGVSLRDWLGRRTRSRLEPSAPDRASLVHEIGDRADDLARLLGTRPFFYADRPGMADLAVHAMLRSLADNRLPGTAAHLERHPNLREFMRRVEEATGGSGPRLRPERIRE